MPTEITRETKVVSVTFKAGLAISSGFDFRPFSGGAVKFDGWTEANLAFRVSDKAGWYAPFKHHDSNEAVQISNIPTTGPEWKALPPELFGVAGYVKLWSKSTTANLDDDVNQVSERPLTLMLKG